MATTKIAPWQWYHKINDQICLAIEYSLYADMANANAQPYLRVSNLEIRSFRNKEDWLKPYVPCTVKLRIDNEEKVYTISSGSSLKQHSTDILDLDTPGEDAPGGGEIIGYYYTKTSNGSNINIPKNGQEFLIHVEVTTNKPLEVPDLDEDGNEQLDEEGNVIMKEVPEVVTFTEHGAGPISVSLNGADTIYTGEVARYTLPQTIDVSDIYSVSGGAGMHFKTWGSSSVSLSLFTGPHMRLSDEKTEVSAVEFLPLRGGATVGEKTDSGNMSFSVFYNNGKEDTEGFVDFYKCIGYNLENGALGHGIPYITYNPGKLNLGSTSRTFVCIAKEGVNEALRPVFRDVRYEYYYQRQVEHYGGGVQNRVDYGIAVDYEGHSHRPYGDELQYGVLFKTIHVDEYTTGELIEWQKAGYTTKQEYSRPLKTEVTEAAVTLTSEDTLGFSTTYTDYVTTIPYHDPQMPSYRARRCSPSTGSTDDEVYFYDGVSYRIDDYGEYALIEWAVDFSPLNNLNQKKLVVSAPSLSTESGYQDVTVTLPDYVCSGYFVTPADPEKSYTVLFTLTDDFHGKSAPSWVNTSWSVNSSTGERTYIGYYSEPTVYSFPLNTVLAMMDFKHGGTGVALGKVSELDKTFDIHRNWLLKMPHETWVQKYDTDGTGVNLPDWMHAVLDRMQAIRDQKPWGIYGYRYLIGQEWFDGYTPALIPEGYGEVYSGGNYRCMMVVPNKDRFVGMTHVEPFTVNRNYLNVRFDPSYSFRGQGHSQVTYTPMIYLCSTRPTTIDQTTGRPNATIVDYQQVTTSYTRVGSEQDGYTYWNCERGHYLNPSSGWTGFDTGILHSFNVASRKGQQLWVVVTCRQGGQSQSGWYNYNGAQMNLYDIVLSNKRANYDYY